MAEVDTNTTAAPKREKKVSVDNEKRTAFPDALVGKASAGVIHEVFKTKFGSGKFGFILVGDADADKETRDTLPRVYFNFTEFSDSDYSIPRKGYGVNFTVTKDEDNRLNATAVTLTSEGKVTAEAREKSLSESPAREGGASKPRVRKPRAVDPREVTLNLTFNGSEKEVLAKLGESLGKLKHVCITAMETENIALQVFHSDGRLLSKEILGAMVDGDKIMLKEKEE